MALYGTFTYGSALYGLGGLPTSVDFDDFDFCEPNDSTMLTLFSFAEVSTARPFGAPYMQFDGSNDLVMFSDDGFDSGFRIDISVPDTITLQFSLVPTDLPPDFSSLVDSRIFIAAYSQFGKMIGLLLSENGGIAIAQDGAGTSYSHLADSADLFEEGSDYYTFRVVLTESTGQIDLYVTRSDLISLIGHQLRYTYNAQDSKAGETDHVLVEVYGNAVDNTTIGLNCVRLGSPGPTINHRPVAVPGPDQTRAVGNYASFDGSGSYDPDPGDAIEQYWWTYTDIPEGSAFEATGLADTPADASGFTNILNGSAGDFSDIAEGDFLVIGSYSSVIKYIHSDGSYIVAIDHVFPESQSGVQWRILKQDAWEGTYTASSVTPVLGREYDETGIPGPNAGDVYLIDGGVATGPNWTGHDGEIATYTGSVWTFVDPTIDALVHVIDEYMTYRCIDGGTNQWEISDPKPWELGYWTGRVSVVGYFLPDKAGLYVVELIVNDGELDSLPAEVLLNSNLTLVPEGIIPDLSFLWDYLSDFWDLVSDRSIIETVWSGLAMASSDELMRLWQNDYSKGLLDIQRIYQRWWLDYDPLFEEPDYITYPATIDNSIDLAGYAAAPGVIDRTYDTNGATLTGVTDQHVLVLGGVCYPIARITGDSVITRDELPATRPEFWQIKSTVKTQSTNFVNELINLGDLIIFEVIDSDGTATEVTSFVYGVSADYISFDDSPISGYLASDDYSVYFKGVLRRTYLPVNELVNSVPRLQEVINIDAVTGAPDVLYENRDYVTEDVEVEDSNTQRGFNFQDFWFPSFLSGTDGATPAGGQYFDSASSTFETTFGAGADLTGYVLDTAYGRFRLYQVISETRVELEEEALATGLTGEAWTIRQLDDPPDTLWGEISYFDNRQTISDNFGRLVSFTLDDHATRTDDLDYLSAIQGLWYAFWFGPTLKNVRVGAQIMLGLPFAEKDGTITDIRDPFSITHSRILIQDADNDTIVRSYLYPTSLGIETNPDTELDYAVGDTVQQFAPLSKGVTVTDREDDSDWFATFLGTGDFKEVEKIHKFGIFVDAGAFSLTNLAFVMSFVLRIKPPYTYPFFVVLESMYDIIDIDDGLVIGPIIPSDGEYPSSWMSFTSPVGWYNPPPNEENASAGAIVRATPPIYDITTRWPNDRFSTCPNNGARFGNLHLFDGPELLPDGWDGDFVDGVAHAPTRDEGARKWDDTDESGHFIHKWDSENDAGWLPDEELLTDGDMEAADTSAWLAWNATLSKETSDPVEGTRFLRVAYDGTAGPIAYQASILTIGDSYYATGWARGDGTYRPRVYIGTGAIAWEGTSSTDWQRFSFSTTAVGASGHVYLRSEASSAGWADFDDVSVTPLLLNDGDMELAGITNWTAISSVDTLAKSGAQYHGGSQSLHVADDEGSYNVLLDGSMELDGVAEWAVQQSAVLTKETGNPHSGSQSLRVAYGGVTNPAARQSVVTIGETYRITGWARGDSTWAPAVYNGAAAVWSGTSSTDWQYFDEMVTIAATGTLDFYAVASSAGYAEFDDVNVELVVGCYQDFSYSVDTDFQVAVRGWAYMVSGQAVFQLLDQTAGQEIIAETRVSATVGSWVQWTLHAWAVSAFDTNNIRLRILTGPAGGEFYVDDVAGYAKLMPWPQFKYDSQISGRTGGCTQGGVPDEYWEFGILGEIRLPGEVVTDWNMLESGVSSWNVGNNALLTKESSDPRQGQCLRIAYNGTTNPFTSQGAILSVGVTYRFRGRARGDGTENPQLLDAGATVIWAGTTSTDWQEFDVLYTPAFTTPYMALIGSSGYIEFDEVSIVPDLLDDGDMEAVGTAAWTAGGSAVLSKQVADPAEQTRYLRITYGGVNNPEAWQAVLVSGKNYRVRGWARGDGTFSPILRLGSNIPWSGTTSTSWQWFDVTGTANATTLRLYSNISAAGYVEFDGVFAQELPEPTYDNNLFCWDASSVEDDVQRLAGPNPEPDNPGIDTYSLDYGDSVDCWEDTYHPGYSPPNVGLKWDTGIPDGWYTRIARRDKY